MMYEAGLFADWAIRELHSRGAILNKVIYSWNQYAFTVCVK